MSALRAGAVLTGAAIAGVALSLGPEVRLRRAQRPLTDEWQRVPVEARGTTRLGISFRPRQAQEFQLDPRESLATLLAYPFDLVRLAAYWDDMEREPGCFDPSELDWQVAAAEKAGKSVIICTGAVKAFGYPEYFVPRHQLGSCIPEGTLVTPATHPELLAGAANFTRSVVERYRDHAAVVAWQVEHEAFDPLGLEHSWRLSGSFVDTELAALREADTTRPVIMNGFLPTSCAGTPQPGVADAWPRRFAGRRAAAGKHRGRRFLPQAWLGERRRLDAVPGREHDAVAPGVEEPSP